MLGVLFLISVQFGVHLVDQQVYCTIDLAALNYSMFIILISAGISMKTWPI